jgi:hypothetical protein
MRAGGDMEGEGGNYILPPANDVIETSRLPLQESVLVK